MDILEKAKEMEAAGKDVIHLEVGEPDFQTPDCIKEKAIKVIREGKLGYTPSLGLPELRKAIANRYKSRYGVTVLPEQVVITSGSSPALQMVFSCLLEEGDEVIMTDPHYACYSNFVKFLGGKPVLIETKEEDNFRFSPKEIEDKITEKSKVVLINSPANPTGVIMSAADMESVSALGITLISDEIYHGLVYDGNEHSILEFDEDAFVIDGFSKRYAMTGWRLGYAVVPQKFVRTIQCLVQNFLISAPTISQWGGLAALEEAEEDLVKMNNEYRKRRDFLLKGLSRIGLNVSSKPAGAFYVLVNMKAFSNDSLQFAYDLLEKANVAVTPGIDFGPLTRILKSTRHSISLNKMNPLNYE
jgi:aspartate/methionine/tyrosine aminotransferase